jgi:repressor of nif and glnA expression
MQAGAGDFDWERAVPKIINEHKVWIIECLAYMDEPLSASQITRLLGADVSLSNIAYHLETLHAAEVLLIARKKKRGATIEKSYWFAPRQ